jgi:hypothetical protein
MKPSLAHDADDDAYAEAMVKCQGYAPACSDAGECLHEGACFTRDGVGFAAARKKIKLLVEKEPDVYIRCWLKLALDAIDDNRFHEKKCIDAMRYLTIQKRVRAAYSQT